MLGAPILAGALVDANLWGTGWRLVFLINVPLGALTLPLAIRSLPRGASHPNVKLDVGGVGLIGLALIAIIYPLIQGRTDGWPAWSFALLAAGVILLLAFLRYERRHRRAPADRADAAHQPHLPRRHRRRAGPLRRLRRPIALRLSLRPARRRLVTDARRPHADIDGRGHDPRHGRLARRRQPTRPPPAPPRRPPHRRRRGRLALVLTGAHTASTWDLVPGLLPASAPAPVPASDSSSDSS